jgi:NAD(P)-dependent dehydrogenase (short-subunit alcohol dehydrogenase family)
VKRFEGRVSIVTGGSSGIGRAVARRLAREGSGVRPRHGGQRPRDVLDGNSVARVMAASGGGSVVCMASTASFMGEETQVAYNISKGAVMQLARSFAVSLAPFDIRVNAVAPGFIQTPASEERLSSRALWSKARSRIPADRPGTPEEVAACVAFLLSAEASYVSGAVLVVDRAHTAGWRSSDWTAVEQDFAIRQRRSSCLGSMRASIRQVRPARPSGPSSRPPVGNRSLFGLRPPE